MFIYTSDNPFNFIAALLFLSKPKIYICQDMYLEQGLSVGFFKRGFLASALAMAQGAALRIADKVVVIGERMKSYVRSMGLDEKRIEIIPNWTDTDLVVPCDADNPFSREHGLAGKFVVMHSGRIGLTQDLELLVECASRLREYADMRFVIVGEGVNKENLQKLVEKLAPGNVIFLPYQPRDMLKYSLASASAGVILCKSGLSSCLVPSKLYAFMASARPVIASVDCDSEVKDVIMSAGCGVIIQPGDLEGLKNAIEKLYKDRSLINRMGSSGREYLIKNASRGLMTGRYRKMIEALMGIER